MKTSYFRCKHGPKKLVVCVPKRGFTFWNIPGFRNTSPFNLDYWNIKEMPGLDFRKITSKEARRDFTFPLIKKLKALL